MSGRIVRFVFADPPGFSGQRNAALIVWSGLRDRGWDCKLFPMPTIDRTNDSSRHFLTRFGFLASVVGTWLRAFRLRLHDQAEFTFLACSQTLPGLLRDGITFKILTACRQGAGGVISLNGNAFSSWTRGDLRARLFRFLARNARWITVVGDGQRTRLASLGIPQDRIRVIVNTADTPLLERGTVEAKHLDDASPLRLLYLSSLITSKGYPVFLDALAILAKREGPPLEAVLCGAIVASPHDEFGCESAARAWIDASVVGINQSTRVKVRWIPGAVGDEKNELLAGCHVFILPTQYPVEAQPLALLEAMASGCSIITTSIAEIPVLLPSINNVAVILERPDPIAVAEAIEYVAGNPNKRLEMALAARQRYAEYFSPRRHIDAWESLFLAAGNLL